MNDEQKQRMLKFVQDKWQGNYRCPHCGQTNWNLSEEVYQLSQFNSGNIVLGGPVVPLVPITCTNCGNTALLNALIAKVVEQSATGEQKNA